MFRFFQDSISKAKALNINPKNIIENAKDHPLVSSFTKIEYKGINTSLVDKMQSVCPTYIPCPYLGHPLLQMIANTQVKKPLKFQSKREVFTNSDGGVFALDWLFPQNHENHSQKKLVIVFQGLTGGLQQGYMIDLLNELLGQGYVCAVFICRGTCGLDLKTPKVMEGYSIEDIEMMMPIVSKQFEEIYAVGISFGGNQLLKFTSENSTKNVFKSMAIVSAPYSIKDSIDNMEGTVYDKFYMRKLKNECFIPNQEILKQLYHINLVPFEKIVNQESLKSLTDFFAEEIHSFRNIDKYYNYMNISCEDIMKIDSPALLLHAKDDPITPFKCFPSTISERKSNFTSAITQFGAHVAWFSGINNLDRVLFLFRFFPRLFLPF